MLTKVSFSKTKNFLTHSKNLNQNSIYKNILFITFTNFHFTIDSASIGISFPNCDFLESLPVLFNDELGSNVSESYKLPVLLFLFDILKLFILKIFKLW